MEPLKSTMSRRRFLKVLAAAGAATVGGAALTPVRASRAARAEVVSVSVDATRSLGKIPETAFGINNAVWDGLLLDPALPGLLSRAGVRVMRYPGGSTSDVYHWQTNTTEPGQSYANPNNTFDAFMGVVRATGAQAMITANYGSGTPEEAAAWVRYANVTKGYGVRYWEIGNEVYGNGSYGADWEYDLHTEKGPAAYARNCLDFIRAMKAEDPTIRIGVVLTMPGDWPDGVVAPGDTMDWNHTVLSIVGGQIDFADVHWYAQQPGQESDSGLLASTSLIPGKVATLRSLIEQYCGSRASQVQIMLTETNSVAYNPGKQTVSLVNALFLADSYMDWLERGVANVDWWDTHNGPFAGGNNSPDLYGSADYGDYGVLSTGGSSDGVSEPPAETPFPPYYGLRMLTKLGVSGDEMVSSSSSSSLVTAHSVLQADGDLALMLVNKDPSRGYVADLSISGFTPAPNPTVYFYGEGSGSIGKRTAHGMPPTRRVTIPPYSLVVLEMSPR